MSQKRSPQSQGGQTGSSNNEIGLRIVSGLLLAVLALFLVKLGSWPFVVLIISAGAIACWEWDGVVRGHSGKYGLVIHIATITGAAGFVAMGWPSLGLVTLLVGGLALALAAPTAIKSLWSATGVFYIGLPALALLWLRSDPSLGWQAILFLFLIVWSTDSGAFFVGRLVGGPRLASRISPKKTWSGAISGVALSAAVAYLFARWLESGPPLGLVVLGAALSITAQFGDLAESAIKRQFNVKDTGNLIPGHGGMLDRIDALLFAALGAALLALIRNPSEPGRALLIWS